MWTDLLKVLEEEIVPRLEREVPHQPTAEQLAADPKLDKFILVFDREGYSPEVLKRFKERRILQSLYGSEADLIPNEATGTLTVRLHYPANAMLAGAVQKLCAELTATQTVFPTTKLRLVYQLADGRPAEVPANPLKPADPTPNQSLDD
jgi:hypothetical protein